MTGIHIQGLHRRFGGFAALDGIDLEIADREFLALLGPSGSGKTTLLRILGGLDFADAGRVTFDGRDMTDVPARGRRIGFVFQNYALFRHMTAARNVAFGLSVLPRAQRPSRREIADRVRELLALVQIEALADRYPDQLSGGQRQRVALARALAIEPRVLLLDEPFGALDAKVRKELRSWLRALHERTGVTSIFVTHDQAEALEMADRVAVMNRGRIEQVDTPSRMYAAPATPFVHDFMGEATRLDVMVRDGVAWFEPLELPPVPVDCADGPAIAFIRPHDVSVREATESEQANATLRDVIELGSARRFIVALDGQVLESLDQAGSEEAVGLYPGARIRVRVRKLVCYPDGRPATAPSLMPAGV